MQKIKDKMRRVIDGKPEWAMNYNVASKQDLLNLTTLLLVKESNVACWRDASGLTPLLKAASLNSAHCFELVGLILSHCPSSVEVCDNLAKNILHHLINRVPSYQDGLNLLEKNPFIHALINHQNQHGNTPLHLAVIDKDFVMVRLLLDAEANLYIKNKDDLSAANLIQQNNILDDTRNPWREPTMKSDVFVGLRDHKRMLRSNIDNNQHLFSLSKTNKQNNVVHVATTYFNTRFAKEALRRFPHLMWEKNLDGNTPLHIAAKTGDPEFMKTQCDNITDTSCLRLQNSDGNTPLHVALLYNNLDTARILVEKDPGLTDIVNNAMEAPLHLVFHNYYDDYPDKIREVKEMIQQMIDRKYEDIPKRIYKFNVATCSKMVIMINLMLIKASYVACWHDASGLTPLHKAASVDTSYNLDVVRLIISHCPQSAEECDSFGRTILHHLVNRVEDYDKGRHFFKNQPEMRVLRNDQDQQGNTPLHLAVIKIDFVMKRLMTECYSTNTFIKNKEGLSATALIIENNDLLHKENLRLQMMDKGKNVMTEKECDAAEHGDAFYFSESLKAGDKNFLDTQDFDGRNFMHKMFLIKWRRLIIPNQFLDFIKLFKDYWYSNTRVMLQADRNGDTPFHILARLEPHNITINVADRFETNSSSREEIPKIFHRTDFYAGYGRSPYTDYEYEMKCLGETSFLEDLLMVFDNISVEFDNSDQPWLMQNDDGNTPLHEAIKAKNFQVIPKIAEFSRKTTAINNRKETVCHLLANLIPFPPIADDVIEDLITNNTRDAKRFHDADSLSPLIRAIQTGNVKFAERLCSICPELAEVTDPKGQTFWHLLVNLKPELVDFENGSFSDSDEIVLSQLKTKDENENTTLHLAIKNLRFDLAKAFLSHGVSGASDSTHKYNTSLLKIENKAGITPGDMIGALPYISPEFEKFIWKEPTMIGTRSMWGIPSTQMKDYVNAMGVIAALLTTITFTTAFTVPGGLNQEKGTPLLIRSRAFQVFMISDVFAMCLSMLVLFCLLWIMATGNKSKSVVLLDFSIILLLGSFYTTLLTFMTGLYATTYHVRRWVTIVSLVPCSMLLLLMHRYLVIHLVIPAGKGVLTITDTLYHFGSETFQYVWKPFRYVHGVCNKFLSSIKLCGPRNSSEPNPHLPISSTT